MEPSFEQRLDAATDPRRMFIGVQFELAKTLINIASQVAEFEAGQAARKAELAYINAQIEALMSREKEW